MDNLCQDVQIVVFSYLSPEEIIVLYDSYKTMIEELSIHKGFAVHCKYTVNDNVILWFQEKNIKLNLLKEYKKSNTLQQWYQNGKLHRDNDSPACIYADGTQKWYQNGLIHRDNDLPVLVLSSGQQQWHQNGKYHRNNDLPAIIYANGTQCWYQYGKRHRDNDLPAIVTENGSLLWYQYGKQHRDNDLPAVKWVDGRQSWYKNGILQSNS